ncbi:MAG: hypothetical protein LBC88_10030, partial [Spirochaetaceae bacterium]|nr:hypothetical protein [Spirochaetaceae bacterium]
MSRMSRAGEDATMMEIDRSRGRFTMGNAALITTVDYQSGTVLEFTNRACGRPQNRDRALFAVSIYETVFPSGKFTPVSFFSGADRTEELISLEYRLEEEKLAVRVHFINDRKDTIRILFQVRDDYKRGVPCACLFRIPLLAEITVNGPGDRIYPPGNPAVNAGGKRIVMPPRDYEYTSDIALPFVICDAEDRTGFSIETPSLSDLNDDGANQNAGKRLSRFETEAEIRDGFFRINPDASFNDTAELAITGLTNGWAEAFDRCRTIWQASYDFSEYQKPDLQWFNECAVHHVTFLFGKEGFDRDRGRIDVEGLLAQGEEFGGYDTVTLWNQYPRLGIDARRQWDFFDDFPGGRAALREAVEAFHRRGVRVFLPFIPWDRGAEESAASMADAFVRLLA